MRYWLMKSEPTVYGIQHLRQQQQTLWDGVRNYQARNFLLEMQEGDLAFFYHSNSQPPGIAGLMRVIATQIVDPSQFDPISPYADSKATPTQPRWWTVKVEFVEEISPLIDLTQLKQRFSGDDLWVVRRGNRLSVMPVETWVAENILSLRS
ncbi:MAG: EVE domain-containing protein [Cyanobacteriota bacterium]|nr:EVE domain-containing protein [Cyanobacteriota bacterium]